VSTMQTAYAEQLEMRYAMKKKNRNYKFWKNIGMEGRATILLGMLILLSLLVVPASAQTSGRYDMSWNTIDAGGTISTGSTYSMDGAIGDPEGSSSGGTYAVEGSFVSVAAPELAGHVTWQGRPTQPNTLQSLPITITLKLVNREFNYPSQTTSTGGAFTVDVGNLANGTYSWRVKGPKYLANAGTLALTGISITNLDMGLMRTGDANNDNVVSVLDINILRGTYGKQLGDPGYDARADFNGDNLVNVSDVNLLRGNFGIGGAPPINPDGR
jgi:hypothetical protein